MNDAFGSRTAFDSPLKPESAAWRATLVEACHPLLGVSGIDLVLPEGSLVRAASPARARLRFHDWQALTAFALRDQVRLFEHYLDLRVDLEPTAGDPAEALLAAIQAFDAESTDLRWLSRALHSSRYFWQQNTSFRRDALSVHYSVPPAFWLAFMSEEYPIYSHYLFEEHETHEAWRVACERKLAFSLDACKLKPGDSVLNIGEGWGGFLTYAGRRGLRETGLTLNEESYRASLAKREAERLTGTCQIVLTDFYRYRSPARFDAITNMGVTEHLTDYDRLMARYAELLRSGGYVYSDFVGVTRDSAFRSLIQKHVYPGAAAVYLPKLIDAAARNGNFDVVATYDDRVSYEKTCIAWARNVEAVREFIVSEFGERRYRWIWSYLWMSVYGFRTLKNGITGTRVVLRRR